MTVNEFNVLLNRISYDKTALTKLYIIYCPIIVSHIKTMFPTIDADDIAQEFFIKLLKNPHTQLITNPTAWILKSCDNIVKKILIKDLLNNYHNFEVLQLPNATDIANDYIKHEHLSIIFSQLDSDSKQIFYMYYWEGYNLREIAEMLDAKVSTVKQKHTRRIKKIKKFLIATTKKPQK